MLFALGLKGVHGEAGALLEAGGDEGDAQFVVEAVVVAGAPDDVGLVVAGEVGEVVGDFAQFVHRYLVAAGV